MTGGAGWVAGDVRGRALLSRRLGADGARRLAASPSLATAVATLAAGPYGRTVHTRQQLAEVEYAVGAAALWHLRVLAGWQPRAGAEIVRQLAGWFELANVVEHTRELAGLPAGPRYTLGRLTTAWSRLMATGTGTELREVLATTSWDDPGAATPAAVAASMELSWAARVAAAVPEARAWAEGGAALVIARTRFAMFEELPEPVAVRANVLLGPAATASTWEDYVDGLHTDARWPFAGSTGPDDLWHAELGWWARVERDAAALLSAPRAGRGPVVGIVAYLALDAWRARAALQVAARGGQPEEAFDAFA
ncbi:MAG: hypothetical protein GEV28_00665 [Actinophytocola sp.]|uniref:hypothetical protein n=1 Tax=Actinophytocola sp. TaxID=1872138 RepID=UPI001324BDA4|nr:hypothetical protein [Actinophytocola sp.]MPZ78981.1 hypothetical protein [Actinophytocola sp.]